MEGTFWRFEGRMSGRAGFRNTAFQGLLPILSVAQFQASAFSLDYELSPPKPNTFITP